MNDVMKKEAFTFFWSIKNFSHCLQRKGEVLKSPVFTIHAKIKTRWSLRLYPRGKSNDYVVLYLGIEVEGTCNTTIYLELSCLTTDNTPHVMVNTIRANFSDSRSFHYNIDKPLSQEEVFETKRFLCLPRDTLNVQCRLWVPDFDYKEAMRCFAFTRIGVERTSFIWAIQAFSTIQINKTRTISTLSASAIYPSLTLILTLEGVTPLETLCTIKIRQDSSKQQRLVSCKISLLDRFEKPVKVMQHKHWFEVGQEVWNFPEFISRKELVRRKEDCLPGDNVTLRCDLSVSVGVEYEKVENPYASYTPFITEGGNRVIHAPMCGGTSTLDVCPSAISLQEDLLSLWNDRKTSDFELLSEDASFPVHKLILSVRSPVFESMFSSEMKEAESDSLIIPDVDPLTLKRFLLYVYTERLEDGQWDETAKLYYAADKYEVLSLKKKCSSILSASLGISNVCDILVLAYRHHDNELESAAHDFILSNFDEVMQSEEWEKFVDSGDRLAGKTMLTVFKKKMNLFSI